MFFALMSSFLRETQFTQVVSEEIATAPSRHTSRRRRVPMPASPRRRARCNHHEARAGIVALMSCCLVRLSHGGLGLPCGIVSLPACTQRSIRRGAALASRLAPLAFSGESAAAAKHLLNGTTLSDPEPVSFSCGPENWAYGQATSESTEKGIISARISFPARDAAVPLLDWLPESVAHDFRNPEEPEALGDDSSLFAVTQHQWRACVRRMLRCKLASVRPSSSLDRRLASGAFAVAKDKNRDRFIGDRRPLDSRERSIGRAHLPCCPRLRGMILETSEKYEVLPSRVTKQVIGPRKPRSWLDFLDDENWDVVDTDEIESWVLQDLLETCAPPSNPSLNRIAVRMGRPQLSWEMPTQYTPSNALTADNCSLRAP